MAASLSPDDVRQVVGADQPARAKGRGRLFFFGLLGIILVIGVIAARSFGGGAGQPQYVTKAVERGDLTVTVSATGTLEPTNEVEISSELSGIIRIVHVDDNDRVQKDEPLAMLDTDRLDAEVAHARATWNASQARVMEAEATLAQTRRDFERYEELLKTRAASEQRHGEAKAAHERAKASLASAKADVAVAAATLQLRETDQAKACICSPIDGVVLKRDVDPGQTVASSFQAPVLFTLAEDLTEMALRVDVDEADVSLVAVGQTATFAVDAYPDRDFPATITKIRFAPDNTDGVVTYEAALSVDNNELLLRPGMTATAEVIVRTLEGALLVPNEVLRFRPEASSAAGGRPSGFSMMPRPPRTGKTDFDETDRRSAKKIVWVVKDGKPVPIDVVTGLSDGQQTEIISGEIAVGMALITDMQEGRS